MFLCFCDRETKIFVFVVCEPDQETERPKERLNREEEVNEKKQLGEVPEKATAAASASPRWPLIHNF